MKRFLKITGITILSLVLAVVVLVGATVGILCHVVFTPEKLTPLVKQVAEPYVDAEWDVKQVNLTLLSTFPNAGLDIQGLYVINPKEGAQNDTVLAVPYLRVGADIMQAIEGDIHINVLRLTGARANVYMAEDGTTNLDNILRLPQDTTVDNDTTSSWTLRSITWEEDLVVNIDRFTAKDDKDHLAGELTDLALTVATDTTLTLEATAAVDPLVLTLSGTIKPLSLDPLQVAIDLTAATNRFGIQDALAIVPDTIFTMPKDIQADAQVGAKAHIYGTYSDSIMPLVDVALVVANGEGSYASIPLQAKNVEARLRAHVDMNRKSRSHATIEHLAAEVGDSRLEVTGEVTDLFDDIHIVGLADAKVKIADFKTFIPENMKVRGQVELHADADLRMSEIEKGAILHRDLLAKATLTDLDLLMNDSIAVRSDKLSLDLTLPTGCTADLIRAKAYLEMSDLDVNMVGGPKAVLGQTQLNLHGEYNTKDTTVIPLFDGAFFTSELRAELDTISTYIVAPKAAVSLSSTRRDKSEPRLAATIMVDSIWAKMGGLAEATTNRLSMKASARHRKGQENILLTWNPKLDFSVQRAKANTSLIPYEVIVPAIDFTYSNRDFTIDTSRIELGRSDFNLAGQITNIGPWLENKGLLKGQLRFTSSHADINQLLDMVSGLGNDEAELGAADLATDTLPVGKLQLAKEPNPFIVPKGVDLSILTHIDTAYAFGETVRRVGGQVDILDGQITVREMGFMCEAAKMNLTGIYRSPRRNHIFAGFDFHMTDIHIAEMINLIPQVDSILPMLRSFKGDAQIHLAAETYTNAYYQIKPSTTRGAVHIEGKDLTLLDGETFTKIAKLMSFKKSSENKIDSISADISLYKRQVTVYPFLLHYQNWKVAAGGEHSLSGNFNYHISVLKPIYLGINVASKTKKNGESGLSIGVGKCLYKKDFTPVKTGVVDTQAMSIRQMMAEALKRD